MEASVLNYIIYISNAALNFDKKVLTEILKESRDWNHAHGITGILLYDGGNIMQILEGKKEEVQTIFRKIETDKRHKHVTKIADDCTEERSFGEWSMAFRSATPDFFQSLNGYTKLNADLLPDGNSENHSVLFLLKTFLALNPSVDDLDFSSI